MEEKLYSVLLEIRDDLKSIKHDLGDIKDSINNIREVEGNKRRALMYGINIGPVV